MDEEAWDNLSAALLVRLHWSWRDLQETPLSVVEAVLDRLAAEQRASAGIGGGRVPPSDSVELG